MFYALLLLLTCCASGAHRSNNDVFKKESPEEFSKRMSKEQARERAGCDPKDRSDGTLWSPYHY